MSPAAVRIREVSPRDGLQIEARFVPTADKVALIDRLSATGVDAVEATSFTSPRAIPALADAGEVMDAIRRAPGVRYVVLVPSRPHLERTLDHAPDEVNLVMSGSDAHGLANLRRTPERSLEEFAELVPLAQARAALGVSISVAFGCPFEGDVPQARLFALVDRLARLGVARVTLCDTTGVADPAQVGRVFAGVLSRWPQVQFAAHFHDTRGLGLANALAAWREGIAHFDASLGGLGGCPFAPGASGNVCTEDMVHMFERMGVATGVDLHALLRVAADLPALVGHPTPGKLSQAGPASRRYPAPAPVAAALDAAS